MTGLGAVIVVLHDQKQGKRKKEKKISLLDSSDLLSRGEKEKRENHENLPN